VKINENAREHDVFIVQSLVGPSVSDAILELLIMIDAFKRASAGRITAVMPQFAYGRSDKKDQPRVPITARLLADLIGVAGADRFLTMDMHQMQIQGFFSIPGDELSARTSWWRPSARSSRRTRTESCLSCPTWATRTSRAGSPRRSRSRSYSCRRPTATTAGAARSSQ